MSEFEYTSPICRHRSDRGWLFEEARWNLGVMVVKHRKYECYGKNAQNKRCEIVASDKTNKP